MARGKGSGGGRGFGVGAGLMRCVLIVVNIFFGVSAICFLIRRISILITLHSSIHKKTDYFETVVKFAGDAVSTVSHERWSQ